MDISSTSNSKVQIAEVATRIKEMRTIMGLSRSDIAEMAQISEEQYDKYESGLEDLAKARK